MRRTFSEDDFDDSRPPARPREPEPVVPTQTVPPQTERWSDSPAEQTLPDQPPVWPTAPRPAPAPEPQQYRPAPTRPWPAPPPSQPPARRPGVRERWRGESEPPRPRRRSGALGFVSLLTSLGVLAGSLVGGLRAGQQIEQLVQWGYRALSTGSVPVELMTAGKALLVLVVAGVLSLICANIAVSTRRGKISGGLAVTICILAPFAAVVVFGAAALGLLDHL